MRSKFDHDLETLNTELIAMGGLIESAIRQAVGALLHREGTNAEEAIIFDREVDRKEVEIESLCLRLLLQQQPVARDLRVISAALKMITDMERIGDQAGDIAEITLRLPKDLEIQRVETLLREQENRSSLAGSDGAIRTAARDLAAAVARHDMTELDTLALQFASLVLDREGETVSQEQLDPVLDWLEPKG